MSLLKGKKNIGKNIKELMADNKKSGKARGANGKPRSKAQILAIALNTAGMKKKSKMDKTPDKTESKKRKATEKRKGIKS